MKRSYFLIMTELRAVLFLKMTPSVTDNGRGASQKKMLCYVLCVAYHFKVTKYYSGCPCEYFRDVIACRRVNRRHLNAFTYSNASICLIIN